MGDLNQALDLHRAGRLAEAVAVYEGLVAQNPDAQPVLNYGGLARFQQGDAEGALVWLQRAVDLNPEDQSACNNLAAVLKATGRVEQATELYRSVVAQHPRYALAHFNLGLALAAQGDRSGAREHYQLAIEIDPDKAEFHNNLGLLNLGEGLLDDAAFHLRRAVSLAPNYADAWSNLGTLLQRAGRPHEARDALGKAVAIQPQQADAWCHLGHVEMELGQASAAQAHYRKALSTGQQTERASVDLAMAEAELGQQDAAIERLGRVLGGQSGASARVARAGLYYKQCRYGEASEDYRTILEQSPGHSVARDQLIRCLLAQEAVDEASDQLRAGLLLNPRDQRLLALKPSLEMALGHDQQAEAWLDYDRWVHCEQVPNWQALLPQLQSHVLDHPSLHESPSSHATRSGRHSGELLFGELGPMVEFKAEVARRAKLRHQAFRDETWSPQSTAEQWAYTSWAVVMRTQGHQVAHIHPSGWLSGVMYVELPDDVESEAPHGWLELGRPPGDVVAPVPPTRMVQPKPGLMVTFPSWLWHRTIPFEHGDRRICIAFDVM